jgi:predicted tellurium resistance membrane protein TerC
MRAAITLNAYETAERELLLTHARRVLRRNAIALAIAAVLLVVGELVAGGAHWLAYLAVSLWARGVAAYYRGWVRHGDQRIREQQFRVEWRAGRSSEQLPPRT